MSYMNKFDKYIIDWIWFGCVDGYSMDMKQIYTEIHQETLLYWYNKLCAIIQHWIAAHTSDIYIYIYTTHSHAYIILL
jgi:hypothetical protein